MKFWSWSASAKLPPRRKIATIFVLVDEVINIPESDILGYYSLSNYSIDITELDPSLAKTLPRYPQLPATLLGRLAVDHAQIGKSFGKLLLIDALKKSLEVSQQIASLAVIAEAIDEQAASLAVIAEAIDEQAAQFYLKYGFQRFNHNPSKLYLPLKSIQSLNL